MAYWTLELNRGYRLYALWRVGLWNDKSRCELCAHPIYVYRFTGIPGKLDGTL
jgi:hypothetical protein